jgi:hypothetical protein
MLSGLLSKSDGGDKMKKLFVLIFLCSQAQAGFNDYDTYTPYAMGVYLEQIRNESKADGSKQCLPMYTPMLQDGVLDIKFAFGYMDFTDGKPGIYKGVNYGYSPSLDLITFENFKNILTRPCENYQMRLCEFSQRGDARSGKLVFEKNLKILGQKVLARLTLTHASASEAYSRNIGELASFQKILTAQSEDNFFNGVKTGDVVMYVGHARNGGGPDFNPPVLKKSHKVDYDGYYRVQKPGLRRLLSVIKENPNPGFVLGLMACSSRRHFQDNILGVNPQQRMILSSDTVDYFDGYKAAVGYLEGMLRGQCGSDLSQTARKGEAVQKGFQQYHM